MKKYRKNGQTRLTKAFAAERILLPDSRNALGVAMPNDEAVAAERKWSIDKKL